MLPGVGGEADSIEPSVALSKYDESDGVSFREETEAEAGAVDMPSRVASVDSADLEADAVEASALRLVVRL
jgi:hypothetical protein